MVKNTRDSFEWIQIFGIYMLGIAFVVYVALQFFYIYNPSIKNNTVTFEVTGITNSENASTLVSLHYECIKYCNNEYGSSSLSYIQLCFNECSKLGKEACNDISK
jgi:hypothetical protein